MDAKGQGRGMRGESDGRRGVGLIFPPTGEAEKGIGVTEAFLGAVTGGLLVAGQLALLVQLTVSEPERRMEEDEATTERSDAFPKVVKAANVNEFMPQHVHQVIKADL